MTFTFLRTVTVSSDQTKTTKSFRKDTSLKFKAIQRKYYLFLLLLGFNQSPLFSDPIDPVFQFAQTPTWIKALHFKKSMGQWKSSFNADSFYLSKELTPLSELQSFLHALRSNRVINKQHIHCWFPFRYRIVLRANLAKAQTETCEAFDFFRYDISAKSAELIYVGQYADNPSSLMGHLFINFPKSHTEYIEATYLGKTFNYAAGIPEDVGIFKYIFHGIFGGFTGQYSIHGYGDLLEKYSNMESRDIFRYPLKLNTEQLNDLVAHTWELIHFGRHPYYFFTENCAYEILTTIEAVTPGKTLSSRLPVYSVPFDVAQALRQENLVHDPIYLPSLFSRWQSKIKNLKSREIYDQIITSRHFPEGLVPTPVIEAVVDHENILKHKRQGKWKDNGKLYHAALLARSKQKEPYSPPKPVFKNGPDKAHGSQRISIGGIKKDQSWAPLLSYRVGVHDLLSQAKGFSPHSSLALFGFEASYLNDKKSFALERFQIIKLVKLESSPIEFNKVWDISLALQRSEIKNARRLKPEGSIKLGLGHGDSRHSLTFIGMLGLDSRRIADKQQVSGGARLGVLSPSHNNWRTFLFATQYRTVEGEAWRLYESGIQFDLSQNLDLRFQSIWNEKDSLKTWQHKAQFGFSF